MDVRVELDKGSFRHFIQIDESRDRKKIPEIIGYLDELKEALQCLEITQEG